MSTDATPDGPTMEALVRAAEPFFERRGPVGVLLLHGYSGAPGEMRPMGQALAAAGYTVSGPLLAGHGGMPDALHGVRWGDWADGARAELEQLRGICGRVFVVGFSMGGLLALHLAATAPLDGLIALAPALWLRGAEQLWLTGLLKLVMPWYYPLARADFADPLVRASVLDRVPGLDLDNPEVVARVRREARVPIGSLHELARLQAVARRLLPRVTAPVLLMQGRNDRVVAARSVDAVARGIRSTDKQVHWFERSGHQLPLDAEREQVWSAAAEWIARRA